jgi:dsDNA-specific endonuclease/ATPase MutS2
MRKFEINDKVEVLDQDGEVSFQGVIISYIEKTQKYLVLIGSMKLTVEESRLQTV